MAPVWLITGASKGFGFELAKKALDAGHNVIGTIRNPAANAEAVAAIQSKGGKVIELELSDPQATLHAKIRDAEKIFGRIDILVNNAGYSGIYMLEDVTEKEVTDLMATNLYGPIFATQAVIPGMRERKSGLIINVSSVMGLTSMPGGSIYSATKFAVEAISESLVKEVAPFNIDVLCVEPGLFYTSILERATIRMSEPYQNTEAAAVINMMSNVQKAHASDPVKAVQRIFEYATGQGEAGALKGKTNRLMLGPDCIQAVEQKIAVLQSDLELSKPIGITTRFDS
ncbi:hypothetical protein BROUX41_002926 [Berkeleyomyces rouxiae]|uniref:uncharacterized protein n=1 Tax=Berkeleyomyces rouxiae TaxID=2035830 RepID=UPI003B80DFA8